MARYNRSVSTPPPPFAKVAEPQITPDQLRQIAVASADMRRIRRAGSIAKGDAYAVLVFGLLTFLFAIGSWSGMLLGAALVAVAIVELRAASRLVRLEPAAANTLCLNQIALAGALVLYAAWSIHLELSGKGLIASAASSDPDLQQMLDSSDLAGSVKETARQLALVMYGGLIAVAVLGQGGLAWYYQSRKKHVERYLHHTPPWILDMQRSGVTV